MPIVHNNSLFKGGVKGTLGKNVVYKYYKERDMVVMANYPKKRKTTSEKQFAQQDRFSDASEYASKATDIPEIKAIYQKGVNPRRTSAYAIALDDYLNAPKIGEINLLTYTGVPGELIRVRAFDDFKVMSVTIRICKADGTLIEEGKAQPRGKKGLWRMVTTVRNEHVPGTIFTVIAKDMPQNEAKKTVQISIAGQANVLNENGKVSSEASDQSSMNAIGQQERKPTLGEETVTHAKSPRSTSGVNSDASTKRLKADEGHSEVSVKHPPSGDDIAGKGHTPDKLLSHDDDIRDHTPEEQTVHKAQAPDERPTSNKVHSPHIGASTDKHHLAKVHDPSDDDLHGGQDRSQQAIDMRWFADGGFLRNA